MKLALYFVVCIVGLVSLFLVFPEASAQAPTSVSSVTFHRDDDQQERIRIKLVGTHAPKVFALKGDNPRLICDFPGAGYAGLVKPVLKAEGTLVKGIRVGAHQSPDKKVRVVLDLEPGRKYTYSREFNKEENILNIVLVPTEGARTAEVAVAKIDATESKQIVITGAKKVLHPVKEQKEISLAVPPPAAEVAASAVPAPKTPAAAVEADTEKPAEKMAEPVVQSPPVAAAVAKETTVEKAAVKSAAPPPPAQPARKDGKPADTTAGVAPPAPQQAAPAPAVPEKAAVQAAPRAQPQAKAPAPPRTNPAQQAPSSGKSGEPSTLPDPLLQEITYENSSSKGEMIFFRLNGFFPPTVSAVESDKPQVVCDFIGMAQQGGIEPVIEARGAYVQKIVTTVDRDPKKIKVVLELTAGRDYDLRQVFFKEDNLFVLIVNALDEEGAATTADHGGK
ncbi:MAG: AMIN domain-containing protein [Desulfoprunum sp.]|jgi:hypothetical protein